MQSLISPPVNSSFNGNNNSDASHENIIQQRVFISGITNNNTDENEPIIENGTRQLSQKEKFLSIQKALIFLQNKNIDMNNRPAAFDRN